MRVIILERITIERLIFVEVEDIFEEFRWCFESDDESEGGDAGNQEEMDEGGRPAGLSAIQPCRQPGQVAINRQFREVGTQTDM